MSQVLQGHLRVPWDAGKRKVSESLRVAVTRLRAAVCTNLNLARVKPQGSFSRMELTLGSWAGARCSPLEIPRS